MKMSDSIKELAAALVKAQGELPTILKDKMAQGERFSYAYVGLESVMPEALAILGKHGLAVTQTPGTSDDGGSNLTTTLLHTSGEWLTDTQPLLLVKSDPQGQGSAITYARRYGLMSMIGLVAEEDDDGKAASPKRAARKPAAKAQAAKPANGKATTPKRAPATQPAGEEINGYVEIAAKFPGACGDCGVKIDKGEKCFYSRQDTGNIYHKAHIPGVERKSPLAEAAQAHGDVEADPGPEWTGDDPEMAANAAGYETTPA